MPEQDAHAEEILKKLEYLKMIRFPYESLIENIFTYVYPGRRNITDKDESKGQKKGQMIYDNTALFALNTLVDGMVGYLCSRNQRWFRFTIPGNFNFPRISGMRGWTGRPIESYPQVRHWLQDVEYGQVRALNRSNFYDQIVEFLRDGAGVGTAHLLSEEDVGSGKIVFCVPHYRQCFIAEDKFGRVDTCFRVYKLTLRQLEQKFGMETMLRADRNFKRDFSKEPYSEREILHAIYPRKDADSRKLDIRNAPIASDWILTDKKQTLDQSGYRWMPSITWRWRKNDDEIYGRGPAIDAMIDILTANEEGLSNLVGAHKMVEPPMGTSVDMRGKVNTGPRSWTYFENENQLKMTGMLQTIQNLPFAVEAQTRAEMSIKNHFGEPFFNVLTQAAMGKVTLSPIQVIEITGERASILGTRVGMIESEAFNPIHDRVFEIEVRANRMPEPPDILRDIAGAELRVEYLGVLAQVQQLMSEVKGIQTALGLIGEVAKYWPPAMDRIDGDKLVDKIVHVTNFPIECLSSEERTAGIRKSRDEAQKRQEQVESMGPLAKLLRAAGPKPESGSPAQKLLNPEEAEGAGAAV